jgi:hypothetical protein
VKVQLNSPPLFLFSSNVPVGDGRVNTNGRPTVVEAAQALKNTMRAR